ncbi:hypothetical protein [Afifella sp. IM 167]|uniref:hypothetical protein n=1 Tax=Afifella sp. IM 167 TaxID=2033586 RepID=UPI001CCFB915|nr:hypothetical protein [Afifella sp. IM 167]MBZ8132231.1 hypothetical protein [Afifella sp. IM 167]
METFFSSGLVVDAIAALMLVEGIALFLWRRRTGRGIAPLDLLANLAAGLFLLLALRAALTGAGWPAVALFLALGGLAHVADMMRRWQT